MQIQKRSLPKFKVLLATALLVSIFAVNGCKKSDPEDANVIKVGEFGSMTGSNIDASCSTPCTRHYRPEVVIDAARELAGCRFTASDIDPVKLSRGRDFE